MSVKEKQSRIESLLTTILTADQIRVIREEIIAGARRIHRIVDENERARARRDEIIALLHRIDAFIERREEDPFFLRTIYGAAKEQIKRLITPLLEEILREAEGSRLEETAVAPPPASKPPERGVDQGEEPNRRSKNRRRRPRRRSGHGGGHFPQMPNADSETD